MGKNDEAQIKQPNEFEFVKTKGFSRIKYGKVTSKAVFGDASLSVERVSKVFFVKGKPVTETVDYQSIEKLEIKPQFSLSDLISGIVIGIVSICTLQFYGLLGTAVLVWCAYGKKIIITRKDASQVFLLAEGGVLKGEKEETERLVKMLNEKTGRQLR
jgi:hypothetical protein